MKRISILLLLLLFSYLPSAGQSDSLKTEWLKSTVHFWQEYRDSCYADSVVEKYRWIYVTGDEPDSVMEVDGNPRNKYQKRTPDIWWHRPRTLDGFMEFLIRKAYHK